jgi:hypothetical protein
MIDRAVIRSKKDRNGDILGLCNPNEYWSPRSKSDVIYEIESGKVRYYVPWTDGIKTIINVVNGSNGKYLRTDKDNTVRNNLDDLLDC